MTSKDPLQLIENHVRQSKKIREMIVKRNFNLPKDCDAMMEQWRGNLESLVVLENDLTKTLALVKAQREIVLNAKFAKLVIQSLIFQFNIAEKEIFSPKEEGKDGN